MTKEILETMKRNKDQIHDENDPEEIYLLANDFDARLWNLTVMMTDEDTEEIVNASHDKMTVLIDKSEDYLIGCLI